MPKKFIWTSPPNGQPKYFYASQNVECYLQKISLKHLTYEPKLNEIVYCIWEKAIKHVFKEMCAVFTMRNTAGWSSSNVTNGVANTTHNSGPFRKWWRHCRRDFYDAVNLRNCGECIALYKAEGISNRRQNRSSSFLRTISRTSMERCIFPEDKYGYVKTSETIETQGNELFWNFRSHGWWGGSLLLTMQCYGIVHTVRMAFINFFTSRYKHGSG